MRCVILPDARAVVRLESDGSFSQLQPSGAWTRTDADLAATLIGDGYEVDVVDDTELGVQEPWPDEPPPESEAKASPAQRAVVRERMAAMIDRWEAALTDVIVAHFARQEAVVLSRLQGVKARKHTRHWRPAPPRTEVKALDAAGIVAPAKWVVEIEQDATDLFHRIFEEQAGDLTDSPFVRDAIESHVRRLMSTTEARAQQVVGVILDLDADDADLAEIVDAVKGTYEQRQIWGAQAARTEVTSAVNEAGIGRAIALGATTKSWLSSRDDLVRSTHTKTGGGDGQTALIGVPFVIGGFPLMYPGDPAGPPHEVINCRCVMEFEGVEPYDPARTDDLSGATASLQADADLVARLGAPSLAAHAMPGLATLVATLGLVDATRDVAPAVVAAATAMTRVSAAGAILAARLPGLVAPEAEHLAGALVLMALVRWHRSAVARGRLEEATGYAEDATRVAADLGLDPTELTDALEAERLAVTE